MKMKTILCAIDYSSSSLYALKYAYEMSKRIDANIYVIHVFESATLSSSLNDFFFLSDNEIHTNQYSKISEYCIKNIGEMDTNLNVNCEAVNDNSVLNAINEKALSINADLIIIGMKGFHNFKDFFVGNTTKKLIEKAVFPVLAVPNEFDNYNVTNIVYATDFKKGDLYAIKNLTEIAEKLNSTIHIVHISVKKELKDIEQMEWFKELLEQEVSYNKLDFRVLFSEDILNTLHNYLEETDATLFAMLERKKEGFIDKIIHGDLVKKFESFINIPLISFNENNY
jgi:nucleotide-binding universal stress UspA family protein